jgi:hypothetical protein
MSGASISGSPKSGFAAQPKSIGEKLAAPTNDSYLKIMEVQCVLWPIMLIACS